MEAGSVPTSCMGRGRWQPRQRAGIQTEIKGCSDLVIHYRYYSQYLVGGDQAQSLTPPVNSSSSSSGSALGEGPMSLTAPAPGRGGRA